MSVGDNETDSVGEHVSDTFFLTLTLTLTLLPNVISIEAQRVVSPAPNGSKRTKLTASVMTVVKAMHSVLAMTTSATTTT